MSWLRSLISCPELDGLSPGRRRRLRAWAHPRVLRRPGNWLLPILSIVVIPVGMESGYSVAGWSLFLFLSCTNDALVERQVRREMTAKLRRAVEAREGRLGTGRAQRWVAELRADDAEARAVGS